MKHRPRKEPDPLNWNFSSCPEKEIDKLFCFEFSRESQEIRDRVDFIRHGQIDAPTYWMPNPTLGWPEWPDRPYLNVPAAERIERLKKLSEPNVKIEDEFLAMQVRPRVEGDRRPGKIIEIFWPDGISFDEFLTAVEALLRIETRETKPVRKTRTGRAAPIATLHDQIRALSVYRLRQYYSPAESLALLRNAYREPPYTNVTAMDRAGRRVRKYLDDFERKALAQIANGKWFPPFGRTVIS